jgi:hypothetical protein
MVNNDRATVADLECFGLSVKSINLLEDRLGIVYVDQLEGIKEEDLRVYGYHGFGPVGIQEVKDALMRYLKNKPIKTPQQCLLDGFSNG